MTKRKLLFTLFLITSLGFQSLYGQQSNNTNPYRQTNIDSIIEKKLSDAGIVGMAAAIIIDKKLVWTKGYGYADKEKGIPFTPSTIINIASISKTLTGACIMKAVEEKKFRLMKTLTLTCRSK